MNNKLWSKGGTPHQTVEQFTVGRDRELDLRLAKHDVRGSIAHVQMLQSIGLLSADETQTLLAALNEILITAENGYFTIDEGVEDIHSQVELLLTAKLGDTGKKIHSGRSRNDQVLVDLKLFMREEMQQLALGAAKLFDRLQYLSEHHKAVLMPGYTHFQIAMPSSFGLWFGAYSETLADDLLLCAGAFKIIDRNPLGSAAGYGSSFPLNRRMTTELLGFESMHYNVVAAQMSRGKAERAMACGMAAIASTLGKLAADICLFMNQNFGFISFPDELTTGSSIMPHKKNPDVFELIRGKCNRLQSLPNELALMNTNLPHGYHRDYQLMKDCLFPAIDELKNCLSVAEFMLQHVQVNEHILDDAKYDYLFTVEEVNRLVLSGMAFRDAYKEVGRQVAEGRFKTDKRVNHTHEGSIGNLCTQEIRQKMLEILKEFKLQ
ncbi:MAG: argininosuccinate lyase [Prevotellaceae bacterium]|jgi:argininosuccinate lyase|nr:argininosuccinate lyase [Prevotellaceae bacterium]